MVFTLSTDLEILSIAARLVVEEGAAYQNAKQRAADLLGLSSRYKLPSNDALEDAILQHITLFQPETQPIELYKLRQVALTWMRKMESFSPYLSGTVWNGSATRHSDIYIQIFCDDPKAVEIHLINQNISYAAAELKGLHQKMVYTLCVAEFILEWQRQTLIYISLHDKNDWRGALKPDAKGRTPRGDIKAVEALLTLESPAP